MPRTVRRGLRAPSLARSWAMWTSTVRVPADSRRAPHRGQELLAGEDPARAAHEEGEQVELRGRQGLRRTRRQDGAGAHVEHDLADAQEALRGGFGFLAAQRASDHRTRTRGLNGRGTAYGPVRPRRPGRRR